jgi:hypothetical protein
MSAANTVGSEGSAVGDTTCSNEALSSLMRAPFATWPGRPRDRAKRFGYQVYDGAERASASRSGGEKDVAKQELKDREVEIPARGDE